MKAAVFFAGLGLSIAGIALQVDALAIAGIVILWGWVFFTRGDRYTAQPDDLDALRRAKAQRAATCRATRRHEVTWSEPHPDGPTWGTGAHVRGRWPR